MTTAPEKAVANGHRFEDDPPHALSSVSRWTCTACGAAALRNGPVEYGSAMTTPCTAAEVRKAGE
ncbi:hypothetical protein [Streptomyces asiaticus]|uniref:hypothetical protein n=1 Tax=Streptomyces asiaticus TaxID=114695 RepID=UPI0031D77478